MPKLPPGDTDRPELKGAKHPRGPALFYMKAVSPPNVRIQDIYVGILPFAALQILCLCHLLAFPQIAMWLPHQMLGR